MFARTLYRLQSRRSLLKADVEADYGELVRTIGGTYYTNGSPTTVSGVLDFRNFARNAGIPNSNKQSPLSVWAVQIPVGNVSITTNISRYVSLPWENIGITPVFEAKVTAWSVCYTNINVGVASIEYKLLQITQNASSVLDDITQGAPAPTPSPVIAIRNTLGSAVNIPARTVLGVQIIPSAAITMTGVVVTVWLKSYHTR